MTRSPPVLALGVLATLAACADPGDTGVAGVAREVHTDWTWVAEVGDLDAQRVIALDADAVVQQEIPAWRDPPADWPSDQQPPLIADFQLLDDGGILLLLDGYGLRQLDASGDVVWEYADSGASHDADRLPDGNTLFARGWAEKGDVQAAEIDVAGTVVWEWTGVPDYADDPRFGDISDEGWAHANTVARMGDGTTRICSRNFDALIVVDADGRVVGEHTFEDPPGGAVSGTTGILSGERPHAAEWLDDTRVLLGLRAPPRVLDWRVDGDILQGWRGGVIGGAVKDVDLLPDGHLLVSSRRAVIELDEADEIVWSHLAEPDPRDDIDGVFPLPVHRPPFAFGSVVRLDATGRALDAD